jgi:Carboxypeptidase regulatory-like domain
LDLGIDGLMEGKQMVRRILLVLMLVLGLTGIAFAQSQATLKGMVADQSGAAVPAAKILVTDVNTGVVRQVESGPAGLYVVPFLYPGNYTLTVQHTGFQTYVHRGIVLEVAQILTLNPVLQVGATRSVVSVAATPPPLATADAVTSTNIGTKMVPDLPLNGRLTIALAALAPAVYPGNSAAGGQNYAYTPEMGGAQAGTSEALLDGSPLSVIDPTSGETVMGGMPPSPDAIAEFKVDTNGVPAEYGRLAGGVINMVTKGGTNKLHGVVREFFRNSALDANDFFANRAGIQLKSFHRNQFGFTVGGPVYIPHVYNGKNRTFFFVDDDITRQSSPSTLLTTVPLPAWYNGNFSGLKDYQGDPVTIYDPYSTVSNGSGGYTRTAFTGNIIPQNMINPVAQAITPYYPAPNCPSQNPYEPLNNFCGSATNIDNASNLTVRGDEYWSDHWRSFLRVNYSTNFLPAPHFTTSAAEEHFSENNPRWNSVWDNTWIINPTTIVDMRANFGRWTYDLLGTTEGFNSDKLGFPSYLSAEAAQNGMNFPGISVSGLYGLGQGLVLHWKSYTYNPDISLTKIDGRHTIKVGMDYRKYYLNFLQTWYAGPNGGFNFNQDWTQQDPFGAFSPTAGFGFASFLLGTPSSGDEWVVPAFAFSSGYYSWYAQDDFRVTKKLTLNYGLRYDFGVARTERYNRMSFYNLNLPSPISGQVPGYPNLTGAMQFMSSSNRRQAPTQKDQIAPRLGLAYQIDRKTVFRTAYDVLYGASPMQAANHNAGVEGFRVETPMVVSTNGGLTPTNTLSNPWPNGFNQVTRSPATDLGSDPGESYFPLPELSPQILQWNATIQRDLPLGLGVLQVGYLASLGHHLSDGDSMDWNQLPVSDLALGSQLNQPVANPFAPYMPATSPLSAPTVAYSQLLRPYPQLTWLSNYWRPYGNSNFQAFTLQWQRRFANGLGFLVSFAQSKLITNSEASGFFSSGGGSAVQNTYNRQPDKAVSMEDVPSRLVIAPMFELPFGKGKEFLSHTNRFVNSLVGGWQVNAIGTWASGQPIPIRQPVNQTGIDTAIQLPTTDGTRIVCTSGSTNARINGWFSTAGLSITPQFTLGNLARTTTSCREPGVSDLDASMFKSFSILRDNRLTAQFRVEAFNVLNKPQFRRVNSTIGVAGTGDITGDAAPPRELQLALKLFF